MDKEIEERLELFNKRIDDNKTLISILVTAASITFGIAVIVFTWNLNTEKADLREFRKEIKNEILTTLGKMGREPIIKLLTKNNEGLYSKTITSEIKTNENGYEYIIIPLNVKNEGDAFSGVVTVKLYYKNPLEINGGRWSTDEKEFDYSIMWQGEDTGLPNIPGGGFTRAYKFSVKFKKDSKISTGIYPVLIKFYYGGDKVEMAKFKLNIIHTTN